MALTSVPAIAYVVGTRPNFVKMAPVISALRRRLSDVRHVLIHTGQHYDEVMSADLLAELGLPEPDHLLGVGSASHAVQTARTMERIEPVLRGERPDLVLVPGDVNSTLAAALVAAKLGLPIAHLEAGLRSFDRAMPEEINRVLTDELSSWLFVHCDDAVENLLSQGVPRGRIHFSGNTMIDSLAAMERRFRERRACERLALRAGGYLLVTLHRPALVDGPLLAAALAGLAQVAAELPVLFPAHPRTRRALAGAEPPAGVTITGPVSYIDFLSLEADAAAVLTDSGGVQEETTYLGVPCFTLRDNTERPVTVRAGTNVLLGLAPARIAEIPAALRRRGGAGAGAALRGWDGRAAERVADVLAGALGAAPVGEAR